MGADQMMQKQGCDGGGGNGVDGAFLIAGGFFDAGGKEFKGVLAAANGVPVWQSTDLPVNTVSSSDCTATTIFAGTGDGSIYIAYYSGVRWNWRGGSGLPSSNQTMFSLRRAGAYLFAAMGDAGG